LAPWLKDDHVHAEFVQLARITEGTALHLTHQGAKGLWVGVDPNFRNVGGDASWIECG
jgi:hypothetical protein